MAKVVSDGGAAVGARGGEERLSAHHDALRGGDAQGGRRAEGRGQLGKGEAGGDAMHLWVN